MPFVSKKQRAWAHTKAGKAKLGQKRLAEFDAASEGLELPEKVRHDKGPGNHFRTAGGKRGLS